MTMNHYDSGPFEPFGIRGHIDPGDTRVCAHGFAYDPTGLSVCHQCAKDNLWYEAIADAAGSRRSKEGGAYEAHIELAAPRRALPVLRVPVPVPVR